MGPNKEHLIDKFDVTEDYEDFYRIYFLLISVNSNHSQKKNI